MLVDPAWTATGAMANVRAFQTQTLLQNGKDYNAISNSATKKLAATSKADALKEVRDFGLDEAYDASVISGVDALADSAVMIDRSFIDFLVARVTALAVRAAGLSLRNG